MNEINGALEDGMRSRGALVSTYFHNRRRQFVCLIDGVVGGPFEGTGVSVEDASRQACVMAGWLPESAEGIR